jgi:hypothetical protein
MVAASSMVPPYVPTLQVALTDTGDCDWDLKAMHILETSTLDCVSLYVYLMGNTLIDM